MINPYSGTEMKRPVLDCQASNRPQDRRTKQCHKAECDINTIVKQYNPDKGLPMPFGEGSYGDFTDVPDLLGAIEIVTMAEQAFALLSSKIRKRFNNDVAYLQEWLDDPANRDEAIELGLFERPPIEPPPEEPPPEEPSGAE